MRAIKYIVVHCTGGTQDVSVTALKAHWKRIGWKNVGYHYFIDKFGTEHQLAGIPQVTNGVRGHNHHSIHVAYAGGVEKGKAVDNRNARQKAALIARLTSLKGMFPHAEIVGHRDLSPDLDKDGIVERHEWVKQCPCFDAKTEYKNIK